MSLYGLAFLENDPKAIAESRPWLDRTTRGLRVLTVEAAYFGRMKDSGNRLEDFLDAVEEEGRRETAGEALAQQAWMEAILGNQSASQRYVGRAREREPGAGARVGIAYAHAFNGDASAANRIADELEQELPDATLLRGLHLPTLRSIVAVNRGAADEALDLLRPTRRYELSRVAGEISIYTRGLALLALERGEEAASEFEKILGNAGLEPFSILRPLARVGRVGLARAKALSGDQAAARRQYQDFFALWKDADGDIPILKEANAEYESLDPS